MRLPVYAELDDALVATLAFDRWPLSPVQFSPKGELLTEPTPPDVTSWVINDTSRGGEGLAVRMTPRAATWIARAKRPNGGESWRKKLGRVGEMKANAARKACATWRAEVRTLKDNPDHVERRRNKERAKERKAKHFRFGEMYQDFIDNGEERVRLLTLAPASATDRKAPVKWLEPLPLWTVPVADLSPDHAHEAFAVWFADAERARIAKKNGAPKPEVDHALPLDLSAAHKALAHAKGAWNLTKAKKAAVNPFSAWAKGRKLPLVPRRQEILRTDTDSGLVWLKALIEVRDSKDPVFAVLADYVLLAILWGGRKTELALICWRNVQHEEASVCFQSETTKGKVDHYVPLTPWADQLLRERRAKNLALGWPVGAHDPVFYYPNAEDHRISDYRPIMRLLQEKSGLWIRLHDLRRTLATSVFGSSKDLGTVKIALGHRSGSNQEVTIGYLERQARLAALRELYAAREKRLRVLLGLEQAPSTDFTDYQKTMLTTLRTLVKQTGLEHFNAADLGALLLATE